MSLLLSLYTIALPTLKIGFESAKEPSQVSTLLQVLILLTILSVAPALLLMLTSFTRLVVVFSILRHALGTQQTPPNQVLISLALFLTLFIMAPTFQEIYESALVPYLKGEISEKELWERSTLPLKKFMFKNTREKDLALFLKIRNEPKPHDPEEVSIFTLIPAFMISELKTAFQIGFLLYIPFLIIDIVISSVLISMGILMLPPMMISLPIKLLLFVLVDGWNLLIMSLVKSFY